MEGIIMANVTTVILIQKCIDAIPSRQFVVIQSQGVYCRKMRCSTVPATDRPPPLQVISASTRCSCQPGISQQRGIDFVLANRYMEVGSGGQFSPSV